MRTATTAASMLSATGSRRPAAAILKAGGIDLLGLMKDGLLTPARIVNLRNIPELGRIVERPDGTLRIGANVTLAQLADRSRGQRALPGARRCRGKLGQSAVAAGRDDRRQSAAAAAMLVFPFGSSPLRAQGRRDMLRVCRRKPVPRDIRSGRMRDRASLDRRHRSGGAGRQGGAGERRWRAARRGPRNLPRSAGKGYSTRK